MAEPGLRNSTLLSFLAFFTVLCVIVLPCILIPWILSLHLHTNYDGFESISPKRLFVSISLPVIVAIYELRKKNLSLSGIFAAVFIGLIMTIANASFISCILVFFFTSSKLTKFRSKRKAAQDSESQQGSTRSAVHVLNNGGVPCVLAMLYIVEAGCKESDVDFHNPTLFISSWLSVAVLGSIASSCGDTWASEVGSAVGSGKSVLITTWRSVSAGTNGGVTIIGTVSSLLGGGVVGVTYAIANYVALSRWRWNLALIGLFSGIFGSTVDSILGATLQYSGFDEVKKQVVSHPGPDVKHISGSHILNNHLVNLISGMITALTAPCVYQYLAGALDV